MINQERLVEEFVNLVKIDSPSGHEKEIAQYLKDKLTSLGLQVYEDDAGGKVGASAGNIIATLPGNSNGPMLLFSAHMDTVEPGRNINPVTKDGIIYSEGETVLGADDKAGIAAILEAVRIVKENDIKHGGLEVVFTIWEEGGLKGSKALDYSRIKSKMGYVLDSDGAPGTIITTAPAQNSIVAAIKGKAAHAGQCPENGINAIQVASRAISKMKLGRIDEETTANIGIIRGGKATNIVPDNTYLEGEARSLSLEKLEAQTNHMCQILQQEADAAGAEIEINVQKEYHTINLKEDDRVVKIAVEAARSLGLNPVLTSTGGGSDANIFNGKGIACANLGIAMNKVHTTEEFIKIDDLCKMALYVAEIIKTANK
ncbi:MAG: M20/M25/M40 family metallo-hydrolase [Desulfotomaculum sp.]|nr:M20/M25/M40 family metallo-hydrolase [Desulfotomaculum sp.]